uniref:Major facilitator superfamily (MFS) profile domain-containing protein n=1 Tax=Fibrocapsa japonica TaxID=94617 RepID=A0A7S2Y534_9STRA
MGRLFWGSLTDKFGYKGPYLAMVAFQTLMNIIYPYSTGSKTTFALGTCAIFFCLGGNLVLAPIISNAAFGKFGGAVYSYLFSAFGVASIIGGIITKKMIVKLGWDAVFRAMAAMSIFSFALASVFKPNPKE